MTTKKSEFLEKKNGIPQVIVRFTPGRTDEVRFYCRDCKRYHHHGVYTKGPDFGHRVSHCNALSLFPNGYFLVLQRSQVVPK